LPTFSFEEVVPPIKYKDNLLDPDMKTKRWVIIPDGRVAVVVEHKTDGKLGVRPVNTEDLAYYPNKAKHWTDEQRRAIPEEYSFFPNEIRDAPKGAIPK
jgi:hypothetical protein